MNRCVGVAVFVVWWLTPLSYAQDLLIRPIIGGLPADSGFAVGAEVTRERLIGGLDGIVTAIGSVKRYQFVEAGVETDEQGLVFFKLSSRYRNYPEEDYWGLGPNTLKENRSNFLQEDIDTAATVGLSLFKLRFSFTGGYMAVNIGPGRDDRFPSAAELLDPQPRYRHVGWAVEHIALDNRNDPRSGGRYTFQWTQFSSSLRRSEIDLRHFFPVREKDRIGVRLQTVVTDVGEEPAPFFMLPTAGGVNTVRGFNQYRFRDRHALALNAEYRYSLRSFFDIVPFVDTGTVFSKLSRPGLGNLKTSGGVGGRLKIGGRVLLGADLAFSNEEVRFWFRSDHTF